MLALATVDYLLSEGREVLLVECDNANPDVFRAYQDRVPTERTDLDEGDGWIHLVNVCDAHRDRAIVVNTAARNNVAVTRYGATLDSSLEALGATLVALWVINRQRDSLELLKEFIEAIPRATVHVIRNGYFGDECKCELYIASKLHASIERRGSRSVTLPDLADRLADDLCMQRLSLIRRRSRCRSATAPSSDGGAAGSARCSPPWGSECRRHMFQSHSKTGQPTAFPGAWKACLRSSLDERSPRGNARAAFAAAVQKGKRAGPVHARGESGRDERDIARRLAEGGTRPASCWVLPSHSERRCARQQSLRASARAFRSHAGIGHCRPLSTATVLARLHPSVDGLSLERARAARVAAYRGG
jgi:hypothetical protein